jgi:ketosteroid isomerase-like protein
MSQDTRALTVRVIDAVNERDLDAYLGLMHDDVEAITRLVSIEGVYRGHDGIRRWWANVLNTWPDFRIELAELEVLEDDLMLGTLNLHGVAASSGLPSEWTVFSPGRWRAGKCVWWGSFATRAEALAAIGVPE